MKYINNFFKRKVCKKKIIKNLKNEIKMFDKKNNRGKRYSNMEVKAQTGR